MKLTFIEEPDLEFGNGSRHIDPRSGINNYGPADLSHTGVRTIQIGIVGTKEAIDGVKAWLDRCREPIAPKESPLSHLYLPLLGSIPASASARRSSGTGGWSAHSTNEPWRTSQR